LPGGGASNLFGAPPLVLIIDANVFRGGSARRASRRHAHQPSAVSACTALMPTQAISACMAATPKVSTDAQTFDASSGRVIPLRDARTESRFDPHEKDPLL